jgi:hypothetical protein
LNSIIDDARPQTNSANRSRQAMTGSLPILQRLFRQECRSFAQYIGESWPWMQSADCAAQDLVRSILADERRWAGQIADLIIARRGQPTMGNYPDAFIHSSLHYLAMDYLLQRLADYLQPTVATLRLELIAVSDDTPVRQLIEQMIERKSGQIEAIRKLARP